MEGKILILANHHENTVVGEEALDFDFEDEKDSPSSVSEAKLSEEIMKNSITVNESEPEMKPIPKSREMLSRESSVQMFKRKTGQGVPFTHILANPLRPKDVLIVEGTILKYGLRFTINLQYGFGDIAFHLNPRLDQNYIARNTFLNGEWGEEHSFGLMKSPLHSGKNFQIMVFISEDAYLVCVNGIHMFSFAHRVPPEIVEKIEIFGDIDLKTASLMSSLIYPDPLLIRHRKNYDALHLPFTYIIDGDLKLGSKIEIKGKIKLLPVSFRVNLQSAEQVYPHPLIPYHLNVRYSPECYVVQNSWGFTGNTWDEEVRSPLPLSWSPGKDCVVNIYLHESYVIVKGENWSLPPFKLRLNLDITKSIYIQGDITMTYFNITPFRKGGGWNEIE